MTSMFSLTASLSLSKRDRKKKDKGSTHSVRQKPSELGTPLPASLVCASKANWLVQPKRSCPLPLHPALQGQGSLYEKSRFSWKHNSAKKVVFTIPHTHPIDAQELRACPCPYAKLSRPNRAAQ